MSGPPISRDGLHVWLWMQRLGDDTVRIQQNLMSEDLQITKYTLNRILKQLEMEGRVRPLTPSLGATVRTYEIVDPAQFFAERES